MDEMVGVQGLVVVPSTPVTAGYHQVPFDLIWPKTDESMISVISTNVLLTADDNISPYTMKITAERLHEITMRYETNVAAERLHEITMRYETNVATERRHEITMRYKTNVATERRHENTMR